MEHCCKCFRVSRNQGQLHHTSGSHFEPTICSGQGGCVASFMFFSRLFFFFLVFVSPRLYGKCWGGTKSKFSCNFCMLRLLGCLCLSWSLFTFPHLLSLPFPEQAQPASACDSVPRWWQSVVGTRFLDRCHTWHSR